MAAIKGFLTIAEAAERLGVSYQRAYQYVEAGRLEAVRVGGKVFLVTERAVKRFKRQPTGRPPKAKAPKGKGNVRRAKE